ncbi:hypothetical protein C3942_00955 [Solimonas fluminis]|uniref:Uncharacterized protein n=1 Tax=Solimonas fluminis TaxID=2086571 RepID=A0A2S5TKN0_9GAMM|nr:hypothetical protein C3942_00955 [Solimonas fluminis]
MMCRGGRRRRSRSQGPLLNGRDPIPRKISNSRRLPWGRIDKGRGESRSSGAPAETGGWNMYGLHQSFAAEQEARRKQAFQRAVMVLGSDEAAAEWLCDAVPGTGPWECRLDQAMDSEEGLQAVLEELEGRAPGGRAPAAGRAIQGLPVTDPAPASPRVMPIRPGHDPAPAGPDAGFAEAAGRPSPKPSPRPTPRSALAAPWPFPAHRERALAMTLRHRRRP